MHHHAEACPGVRLGTPRHAFGVPWGHTVPPPYSQAEKQASRTAAADANRLLRQRQKGADPAQVRATYSPLLCTLHPAPCAPATSRSAPCTRPRPSTLCAPVRPLCRPTPLCRPSTPVAPCSCSSNPYPPQNHSDTPFPLTT
eukprot:scaffold96885_cov25-Phaeocystis_antarctica.AAC.1